MPFNAGRSLVDLLSGFIPGLSAIANHERSANATTANINDLSQPQQSPVSVMAQQSPQQSMQPPQMNTSAPPPALMGAPGGTPQLPPALGQMLQAIMASKIGQGEGPSNMQMFQGGGSPPGAQVPGGTPSSPGVPQAMGASTGGGPQPAAQPPMVPQQQEQQRDPNVSAVAQPTGQGVIADGNANLRAIVTGLRKSNPNASPETIMRATMERIGMLKGVQPEVKDAMLMQARAAQTEFKYTQLQEQMDRKDAAQAEKQRNDDMVNKAREDAITAAGLRVQMGVDGRYTVARLNEGGRNSRFATGEAGKNDRFNKGEAGKNSRFTQSQADKDRIAGANRDLKRILGDSTNLTRVAQTYMKSHPSATPEAAAAYAKKIAPPGGGGSAPSSGPSSAQVSELKKYRSNPDATKSFDQRFGKGAAARALASK